MKCPHMKSDIVFFEVLFQKIHDGRISIRRSY
jgi:hypothetical protein